jgi:hypothetical protein
MPSAESLKAWGDFLRGLGYLLWPLFAFIVAFVYKKDISFFLMRLKKGKGLGGEVELAGLEELNLAAAKAEVAELPKLPPPAMPTATGEKHAKTKPISTSDITKVFGIKPSSPITQPQVSDVQAWESSEISNEVSKILKTRSFEEGGGSFTEALRTGSREVLVLERSNLEQTQNAANSVDTTETPEQSITGIIDVARTSPQLAVISLAVKMERQVNILMAVMGLWPEHSPSFLRNVEVLEGRGYITPEMKQAISTFLTIRNPLVHGRSVPNESMVSAIDSGLRIYETLLGIPHQARAVIRGDLALYTDQECNKLVDGMVGVMLTGNPEIGPQVFPSLRFNYYRPGMRVSWEWNKDISLGETWYLNPFTKRPTLAFLSAMIFAGRDLSEII